MSARTDAGDKPGTQEPFTGDEQETQVTGKQRVALFNKQTRTGEKILVKFIFVFISAFFFF